MTENVQFVCNDCTHPHESPEEPCRCGCTGDRDQRVSVRVKEVSKEHFDHIFGVYADSVEQGCTLQIDSNTEFRLLTLNGSLIIIKMVE